MRNSHGGHRRNDTGQFRQFIASASVVWIGYNSRKTISMIHKISIKMTNQVARSAIHFSLAIYSLHLYFARDSGGEVLWWAWARLPVCLCICRSLRKHISTATPAIFTKFLWMLPMSVAWSFSGRLMKSQREGGNFWGFPLHWQCIVTRSLQITSCSRRDHSWGWWECPARAKRDLRLSCHSCC